MVALYNAKPHITEQEGNSAIIKHLNMNNKCDIPLASPPLLCYNKPNTITEEYHGIRKKRY